MELPDTQITGRPCVRCGGTARYKVSGRCVECARKKPPKSPEQRARAALSTRRWRERHAEEVNAKRRELWATQKERLQEYKRRYAALHPERVRAAAYKWRDENYEKFLSINRAYKKRNAERIAAAHKKWQQEHPERVRGYRSTAKARRRTRESGSISEDRVKMLIALQRGRCAVCQVVLKKYQIDHIHPLALGGEHCDDNIQLLCPPCNRKKSYKLPEAFMREQGKLL